MAEGLFEWPAEEARLLAGRCLACGTWVFPRPEACPRCSDERIDTVNLPRRGRLWSFTIQRFAPKPPYDGPEPFEPYGVGYVEFPGMVLVEGRLTEKDPSRLYIGQEMEVCLEVYTTGSAGEGVVTFAFRPLDSSPQPH